MSTSATPLVGPVPAEVATPILKEMLLKVRRDARSARDCIERVTLQLNSPVDEWPDMTLVSADLVSVVRDAHHAYACVKALQQMTIALLPADALATIFPLPAWDTDLSDEAAKGGA